MAIKATILASVAMQDHSVTAMPKINFTHSCIDDCPSLDGLYSFTFGFFHQIWKKFSSPLVSQEAINMESKIWTIYKFSYLSYSKTT